VAVWFQPLANGQSIFMTEIFINVEVAYALAEKQLIIPLQLIKGSTVDQAILSSKLLSHFSDINLTQVHVGIFGQVCQLNKVLMPGDRVEIYRPLICDPKQARRNRASYEK